MSRRKQQWIRNAVRAGGVDKLLPHPTQGKGEWLTKSTKEALGGKEPPAPGTGRGTVCTVGISARKEALVRNWAKVIGK